MSIHKKTTQSQKDLLDKLYLYKYVKNSNGVFEYNDMKNVCDFNFLC